MLSSTKEFFLVYCPICLYAHFFTFFFQPHSPSWIGASQVAKKQTNKKNTCQYRRRKRCRFDPGVGKSLKESMATHCSILAWRIPCTGEPGGLQSTGSQRWWGDLACTYLTRRWGSYLLLYLQQFLHCLAYSRHSVNVGWVNESLTVNL